MKQKIYFLKFARKIMALMFFMTLFSGSVMAQSWTVYDGSVVPNETVPAFSTSSGSYVTAQNLIIDDPAISGNKFLRMAVPAPGEDPVIQTQFYWRMNFASHGIAVEDQTIVMRLKGNPERDMAMDIELHYNDKRSRITLHTATSLARIRNGTGTDATLDVDLTDWNIFRFVMNATETKMYVNEDPTPALVFVPVTQTSANRHFRFGDGDSGNTFGADIDWIIWDVTGDYAPGEGLPIPAELLPPDPQPSNWTVYNASVLPNAFVPAFVTASGSFVESENQIINDPEVPGNKLLWMDIPGIGGDNPVPGQTAFLWRQNFAGNNVTVDDLTLVMRVKGHPDRGMALDLDMDYNTKRTRVSMHSTYQSQNNVGRVRTGTGSTGSTVALPVDVLEWNTYRFAMNATATKVYINEDPDPVMIITPAPGSNSYFRFGDGDNGATFGADIDWVIWDVTGSFAPGEGSPLPDFSFTPSSDATLEELNVDGALIDGFNANVYQYELVLPTGTTVIPEITAVANDPGATVVVTQADAIPGTATVEVTAENGFTVLAYSVAIRLVSTDATLEEILVNSGPLAGFDANVLNYTVHLPLETTTEIPVVAATANDENASVAITQAAEIEGTATILVTAEDGVTGLTYTVTFVLVSTDATLSDLLIDGTTIEGFDADFTEYNYLLAPGTTEVPQVTAVANNENADVQITQATGIPGTATVLVTAEDEETTLTYNVNFLIGSSNATLSDLLVDGATIAGFSPEVTEYEVGLPLGTTEVPVVTAIANDENATFVITPATEIPGTTSVLVTAEDNFTEQVYLVNFRHVSNDATLQAIYLDGAALVGFDSDLLIYDILIPKSSNVVPVVSAVTNDDEASVEVTQASQIPGTALAMVTAEDGQSTLTYSVNFLKSENDWRYYDASVLPNEHVPTFNPSNVNGTANTNVIVPDPAVEGNSFLELITPTVGSTYMWSTPLQPATPAVTFVFRAKAANNVARRVLEFDVHHNGIRERLYINREMNRIRLNHGIGGGDGGEIPAPEGVNLSDWNIYRLTKEGGATKVYLNENPEPIAVGNTTTTTGSQYFRFGGGNSTHDIATLIDWIVWDETGAYAPEDGLYIPAQVVTPDWDANLAQLLVDGAPIAGFDPDVVDYEVVFTQAPSTTPVVSATASNQEAEVEITQAAEFPGVATVEVMALNGFTEKTYTVTFRLVSNDATLDDLLLDNVSIVGFDPNVILYDVMLPVGTVDIPVVTAIAAHPNATVAITQATAIPGSATIEVTAEDGSKKTYTVNFTKDSTGIISPELGQLNLFPNPATSHITIQWDGVRENAQVEIINLAGQIVLSKQMDSNSQAVNINQLLPGTYIVRVISGNEFNTKLFVKQ